MLLDPLCKKWIQIQLMNISAIFFKRIPNLYNKATHSYIYIQTAGPVELKFFVGTHGWPGVSQAKKFKFFSTLQFFF